MVLASIKEGALGDPREGLLPCLVVEPGAIHISGGGMLGSGPISGIPTVHIAHADGRREQVSGVIAGAFAMLAALVQRLPAR